MDPALTVAADGTVILTVHVQPGARRPGFAGRHGDAIKLRVTAPPSGGRANAAVCAAVAAALGLRAADVTIVGGTTSRHKRLALRGVTPATVTAWLATLPS